MQTYKVEICETLCRVVEVQAESPDDAVGIMETRYHDEGIVLDETDFQDYTIKLM